MDAKMILGRILQRLIDQRYSKYDSYNTFGFVSYTSKSVTVSREDGADTPIPFSKLLKGIKGYQNNIELYDKGPTTLRSLGLTHITSPMHSLLHLLPKDCYSNKLT